MGYDLYITRADEWYESEKNPITLDEWHRYVASCADMEARSHADATNPEAKPCAWSPMAWPSGSGRTGLIAGFSMTTALYASRTPTRPSSNE